LQDLEKKIEVMTGFLYFYKKNVVHFCFHFISYVAQTFFHTHIFARVIFSVTQSVS
jgi:hypothetical protein